MNKKGFAIELIAFVIIGIIAVAFFAMFMYGYSLINTTLTSGEMDTSQANLTKATQSSFSYVDSGMSGTGGLQLIAAIMVIGYMLATLIFAYFSSKHQLWTIVYIMVTILIVIFSIYISNSYDDLTKNSLLGDTVAKFTIVNFIASYLPLWTGAIGVIGIVLCIVGGYVRRQSEG